MIRKTKLLICTLVMSMMVTMLSGMTSMAAEADGETQAAASELQDENSQRLEEVTAMDEEGNIYEIGESDGTVAEEDTEEAGETTRFRSRSIELKVVNLNTKDVSKNTKYYDENGDEGYTNGHYGADAAYLGTTSNGKIRFMLAGVIGTVSASEVQIVDYSSVAGNVSYYMVSGGDLIHYVSQNLNTAPESKINNGPAPSYLEAGRKYYSYDGHYFYTDYGTMTYDYQDGVRTNAVNADSKFTNYFQFFDMNQSTNYTAEELNSILNDTLLAKKKDSSSKLWNTGSIFVKQQDTYGVNALLSVAVAINESGWGTSNICQTKNNLFGLNAQDSNVGNASSFNSVESCIIDFMKNWMVGGYLKDDSWKNFGEYLGNKGGGINVQYASDPYWGEKAAAHAWTLDENGGSKDYLGISSGDDTSDGAGDSDTSTPSDFDTSTNTPDGPSAGDTNTGTNEPGAEDTNTGTNTPSAGDSNTNVPSTPSIPSAPSTPDRPNGSMDSSTSTGNSGTSTATPDNSLTDTSTSGTNTSNGGNVTTCSSNSENVTTGTSNTDNATVNTSGAGETVEEEAENQTQAVSDAEKKITVSGNLSEGASVSVDVVEPNTDKYVTYVSAGEVKGKTVLGVYDITLTGEMDGEAQLTFHVGTAYNEKNVIILHYLDDGTYETYKGKVENGQVTIKVKGFSPYVIALDDNGSGASAPKTGDSGNMLIWIMLLGLSVAAGTTVLVRRKVTR